MSDDINKKVIDIFSSHNNKLPVETNEKVKFYAGFNYVRIDKDANGNKFNPEHLKKICSKLSLHCKSYERKQR